MRQTQRMKMVPKRREAPREAPTIKLLGAEALQQLDRQYKATLEAAELAEQQAQDSRAKWARQRKEEVLRKQYHGSLLSATCYLLMTAEP